MENCALLNILYCDSVMTLIDALSSVDWTLKDGMDVYDMFIMMLKLTKGHFQDMDSFSTNGMIHI
jgi:hypothetical protein